jgi:hypothetical protein
MKASARRSLKWGPLPPNDVGRFAHHIREGEGRKIGKDGVQGGDTRPCPLIDNMSPAHMFQKVLLTYS